MQTFPVSSETNPKKLAGAIANQLLGGDVTLAMIGAEATHRATLAIAQVARWGNVATCIVRSEETEQGTKLLVTVKK